MGLSCITGTVNIYTSMGLTGEERSNQLTGCCFLRIKVKILKTTLLTLLMFICTAAVGNSIDQEAGNLLNSRSGKNALESTDVFPKPKDSLIELKFPAFPTVIGINQICEILPHRFPFLLVGREIEYN